VGRQTAFRDRIAVSLSARVAMIVLVLPAAIAGVWAMSASRVDHARSENAGSAERDAQIAAWSNALAADSLSAIALGQLGALHLQKARETGDQSGYVRAEGYARKSISLRKTRNGSSFVTLGAALVARHEFAAADSVISELVSREPDIPQYLALLGEIKLERGDYDAARIAFSSVHGVRTHLSVAPRLSRWMELTGNSRGARDLLHQALAEVKLRPDLPREQAAWFYLRAGDLDMQHGRLRGARKTFEAGLERNPGDHRLLSAMSRLEAADGNPRMAILFGERAVAIRPDLLTLGALGNAYAVAGDTAMSSQYFKALEATVSASGAAHDRASSLMLLDRNSRVREVLAVARTDLLSRHDIYGYDILAWALHKSGRNIEAREAMAHALRLGTDDAMLSYHAGAIERALGNDASARLHFERALAINPRFDKRPQSVRAMLDSLKS